jgi:GntR family transcriptional regulator, transcriptional repressor for pyruvate dehydrogenase complex
MVVKSFKPVKQPRVSEAVTEQLKQAILLGHFKAGDRLPAERELSEQFQVSRVAVREALRVLENAGFIVTRQGVTGGAYVTDLSFQQLVNAFVDLFLADKISVPELHRVRRLIEPEVARLAAEKVTPDRVRELREALAAEERPAHSVSEEVEKKTAVHFILADMCGNRFLEALVRSIVGLSKKIVETIDPADPEALHPAGMHQPIVEAVVAGDPAGAARAMEEHTTEFGRNLIGLEKAYRERKNSQSR